MTQNPEVLVVGEALVDIVHRQDGRVDDAPGGSPANVALTLGRLGRHPRLLTCLGDDDRGASVGRWLADSDVRVDARPIARTSTAVARLDASGAAEYDFDIEWRLDGPAAPPAEVLHVGSIAAVRGPGAETVRSLVKEHQGRALVSLDPNIRPRLVDDRAAVTARIAELISLVDVVKASDEDAAWLHPNDNLTDTARRWADAGPALVVITRGGEGLLAVHGGQLIEVTAPPVTVVDTVGAGDTVMGALLDGLIALGATGASAREAVAGLDQHALTAVLTRAARAAAITVSRPGADPPRLAELEA